MKKVIFAVATAIVFSGTIGVASAYDYNHKAKAAEVASCSCTGCACTACSCSGCSNGSCNAGTCKPGGSCASGSCCKK